MRLKVCAVCGVPSPESRCPRHRLGPHARGNAYEPLRMAIAERDAWTCQICGDPIDRDAPRGHPLSLHIDCILPRARGGSDTDPDNLQAAHAICNTRKGDNFFPPA